jgi:acetylornithine deacetylase/succinyl-diaminopimelate desuccinylase-like protein
MPLTRPFAYVQRHRQRFVTELPDFVRFASVSAPPKHHSDMQKCAVWLANHLRRIGLEYVDIMSTPRHPLVYAERRHAPERPTVLTYGHYGVQPADPLHEWRSPQFEPVVYGNNLYVRGACDDKGQMFAHLKALEAYFRTERVLPVNVKCLFEGEEEIGSPNLTPFLSQYRSALAADVAVMSDMPMVGPDRPAITYAMRGALSLELEICGPEQDLHFEIFGGAIHDPLQALREIIARLHDVNGRVAIPSFYDRVRRWSEQEREYMACTGPSDGQMLRDAQVGHGWGERGYTLYERTTTRPALAVNGIIGGYQGPGGKAVTPAGAVAKLSFRLVPDQDPAEIDRLFRKHIARLTPPVVRSTVRTNFMAKPALVNRRHPGMRAAQVAYRRGLGATPVFLRSGGTIPIVNTFQAMLGIPTVLMGFSLPDDRMHAPNEKFPLPNFYHGIATAIWFLAEIDRVVGLKRLQTRQARSDCLARRYGA